MKVYILTDLEGVGGVVVQPQTFEGNSHYENARHLLTQEVNAAVHGAIEGGAREIVVLDGHGANYSCNFIYEELHDGAKYIMGQGWPKYPPLLDNSFSAFIQLGAHAMSGTRNAILEHTMSSATWVEAKINGRPVGEQGLLGAIAGHYGVPVALVTGDTAACTEAKEFFGNVETAEVKRGLSRTCAELLPPHACRELIREKTRTALERVSEFKPFVIPGPVEIEIKELRTAYTDRIKEREGITIKDGQTVVYNGADIVEAVNKWLGG